MAKKVKTFTENELELTALHALDDKYFGGLSPSDHGFDWQWAPIKDFNDHVYGVVLRFGLQCVCQSFVELGYYPVFDKQNCEKLLHYKRKEDLTDEELHDLKVDGFLAEFPKYDN